jgi:eukaryotic-like serine/threonine-protein kinase
MKKNLAGLQNDGGPTVDFSINTSQSGSISEPSIENPTVEFQVTRPPNDDTNLKSASADLNTIEHTPMPGPAKGVVPDTFLFDETKVNVADQARSKSAAAASTASRKLSSKKHKSIVGRTIGDYRIDCELGRGGMGVVYRAHHEKLRRDVAIKMILGAASCDQLVVERFETEARAVANLQHPNVVQLFEFGSLDDSPFFALEYIDGGTLAERIKEFPMDSKEAAKLVESLARAMQVAHQRGILHRDLKPANILLTADGIPKISDFGLAKELLSDKQDETKTGTVMGTPSFMSPEQAMGNISELSGATDQYSLGAILYACISGRPPFMSSTTIETISQVVHKEPIPPRQLSVSIPVDLETICLKTLHKEPAKRYANCEELANDIKRFLNDEPILARPVSKLERGWRWCRRNPKIAIPSAMAGIFILSTATIASWAWAVTSAQAAVIAEERDNVKIQRDDAQRQRDEADKQRLIANQQKAVAEDNEKIAQKQAQLALKNIQFVVTDVDKLLRDQAGMSEIRLGVLESVSKKWDELNVEMAGGVRGEAIPTLMAVRQLMAITFRELDRLQQASAEFSKLEEMARERIAVKGRNDATRTNLAKVLMNASQLYRRQDDPQTGIKKLEDSIELVREVIRDPQPEEGSPSKNEILQLLAATTQNLGVEFLREGRILETEKAFTESLDANSKALEEIRSQPGFNELNENEKDTKTAALKMAMDKSRLGLAYIQLRLGKTDESLPLYKVAIESRREIFQRRPNMLIMKSELAGHLKIYGKSLMWLNRLAEAEAPLRESLKLSEESWEADPEKVDLKRGLSEALYLFGWLRELQNNNSEAISQFERSRLLREQLSKVSPDEKNQINLMLSEATVGNIVSAKKIADELGAKKELNSELHLERARTLALLSKFASDDQKQQLKNEALDALERSVKEGFSDPFRIKVEPELLSIHDSPRFASVITQLSEKAKK